jgi:hypothetical protein
MKDIDDEISKLKDLQKSGIESNIKKRSMMSQEEKLLEERAKVASEISDFQSQ